MPSLHGTEVHRRPRQDSSEVHAFLSYLESASFGLAPRFLGFSPDGAERLTYIAGTTGYPPLSEEIRSDDALASVARAIRAFHDTSQGYTFSPGFQWHGYEWARPARVDCIGHFDLAPWNFVFDGTAVTGILDWDAVGPSSRVWDIAYAAYQFVPFHPSQDLAAWGWPTEPDRRARLRLLIGVYGIDLPPQEVIDSAVLRIYGMGAYIDQQVRLGNPAFEVHAREGHAAGFLKAAASLMTIRDSLI
jgi:hypothetical protein